MKISGTTFPTLTKFEISGQDIVLTELFLQVNFLAGKFTHFVVL